MKSGWLVGGGVGLGFVMGILAAPMVRSGMETDFPDRSNSKALTADRSDEPAAGGDKESRKTVARDKSQKPAEERISIPLKEATKLIQARLGNGLLFYSSPMGDGSEFNKVPLLEALTLLGATEREREEVTSIFENTAGKLQAAEAANIRVGKTSPSEIELDVSNVTGPVKQVLEQMKSQLQSALPDARGEALVGSISWNRAHATVSEPGPEGQPAQPIKPYRLQIVRFQGQLMARCYHSSGWQGYPLPQKFVDDGSPIPASEVFGKRWQSWTSGATLVPMDSE